jgi:glycosyltransferase involved in cell wall biosynthesis
MKSQNTTISIGMPVHNGGDHLYEALKSIVSQTYKNLEIIISDDNSDDDSREIIESFKKKDKRIKVFYQKQNLGSLPNFNFVLKKASGSYFMWAAQDDVRDARCVEKLYDLMTEHPDAVLSVSNYKNRYKKTTYFVYPETPYDNDSSHLDSLIFFIKTYNIPFFYGLYKTDVLKKTGGYHTDNRWFYNGSDFLSIYKVLLKGRFVRTSEVLFYKRDTGHFTDQRSILRNKQLDRVVLLKILRYLTLPLYFTIDLFLCLYLLLSAPFSWIDKLYIKLILIFRYLLNIKTFISNIMRGVMQLLHLK